VDNLWTSICWSDELGVFVAVADNTGYPQFNQAMTSTDGVNWISAITPLNANWHGICYSPSLNIFAAVGETTGYVMATK
jgi:hypothetical protein